jgi:hypothetical protein
MPTYMDRHEGVTVTPEELAAAHAQDVEIQGKYGVMARRAPQHIPAGQRPHI